MLCFAVWSECMGYIDGKLNIFELAAALQKNGWVEDQPRR